MGAGEQATPYGLVGEIRPALFLCLELVEVAFHQPPELLGFPPKRLLIGDGTCRNAAGMMDGRRIGNASRPVEKREMQNRGGWVTKCRLSEGHARPDSGSD